MSCSKRASRLFRKRLKAVATDGALKSEKDEKWSGERKM